MAILIFLIGIISYSFSINIKFKFKQEEAIVIAFLGTILLTYLLGLINLLGISVYVYMVVLVLSVSYNLYSIKFKDISLKELITLPSIIYYLVVVGIYFRYKNFRFIYYDEFMFWGTNVKLMLAKDVLWANKVIDAVHQVYPPLSGIEQYMFCKLNNGFNEGMCYIGIITLMATPVLLLFRNEKYNIKTIMKMCLIYFLYYIAIRVFRYDIANLSVDCLLAIIFTVTISFAYFMDIKSKKDIFILVLLLTTLTLIKTNGILFSAIVIGVLFIVNIGTIVKNKNKKEIKKILILIVILIAIVLATYFIWTVYYKLNGKTIDDRHDKNSLEGLKVSEFINVLKGNSHTSKDKKVSIFEFFKKALKNKIIINKELYSNTYWVVLYVNVIAIILIALNNNKIKNIFVLMWMNIGFVIYLLSNLYMFLFVFTEAQGMMLMGLERYIAIYLLAFLLSIISIAFVNDKKRNWLIILIAIGAVYTCMDWSNFHCNSKDTLLDENASYIIEYTSEDSKIYIIDEKKDYGVDFQKLRYKIAPRTTNLLYEWNISTSDEETYYQRKISQHELLKELNENDYEYVFIMCATNQFLVEYNQLFDEEGIKEMTMNLIPDYMNNNTKVNRGLLFKVGSDGLSLVQAEKTTIKN